jgi:periplasmic protein TonB
MHIPYRTDESYNNRGLLISLVIHGALLLGFFFIVAWYPPNPPLPGAPGIAINFGVDDFGMGENNEQPAAQNEVKPVEEEPQEEVTKPADVVDQAEVVTTTEETPYKVEEKKEKKVKDVKKITDPIKEVPKETKTVVETKVSTTKVLDGRNSMGNGDKNKAGDQGKENGTLDSKNYYGNGNSGNGGDGPGGNGTSLNMSGWRWTSAPKVKDNSSEAGKIIFKIVVDEEGTILSAIPVENQLSPALTKVYKEAVLDLTLEKTSLSKAAENSVGYITFIIRTK